MSSKKIRPAPKKKPAKKRGAASKSPAKINTTSGYDAFRESQALLSRDRSAKGREIGTIPDIADPARRERCLGSYKLFCQTYNPEAFALPWADYQDQSADRIEEVVKLGALYAMAEPRG